MRTTNSAVVAGVLVSMLQTTQFVSATSPEATFGEVQLNRRQLDPYGGLRLRGLNKRQPAPASTSAASAAPTTDLATWTAQVESDCLQSVTALGGSANNPSGMAACYNVPFIDEKTGAFAAELRVYNVSAPTADWTGVTSDEVMVSLAYLGATAQRTKSTPDVMPNIPAPQESQMAGSIVTRFAPLETRQSSSPSEIQVLSYVGQFNKNLLGPQMNRTDIQALLIPRIEVSALNAAQNNDMVATILSSKQATATAGVFADGSDKGISPAEVAAATALVNSLRPFVIPGVTLAFFPVGLVVTGVWIILFVGAIGAGTIGRYQFADEYRRSLKSRGIENVATI